MDIALARELQPMLDVGERLLWTGRPRQGLILRTADAFLIPFSLLWCGFAIFWEMSVNSAKNAPPFFLLFGLVFVVVGLNFVFGRFFIDAAQRKRTLYAVTNERILIVNGLFSRSTKSLNLRMLTDVSLTERSTGKGFITFGPTAPWQSMMSGMSWPGMSSKLAPQFDLIDDAKSVYNIIREAQKRA